MSHSLAEMNSYLFEEDVVSSYDYVVQFSGRCQIIGRRYREESEDPPKTIFVDESTIFNHVASIANSYTTSMASPARILIEDIAMFHGCRIHDFVEHLFKCIASSPFLNDMDTNEISKFFRDTFLPNIDVRVFLKSDAPMDYSSTAPMLLRNIVEKRVCFYKTIELKELRAELLILDSEFGGFKSFSDWRTDFSDLDESQNDYLAKIWCATYLVTLQREVRIAQKQLRRRYFWHNYNDWGHRWDEDTDIGLDTRIVSLEQIVEEYQREFHESIPSRELLDAALGYLVSCNMLAHLHLPRDTYRLNDRALFILPSLIGADVWQWLWRLTKWCRLHGVSICRAAERRGFNDSNESLTTPVKCLARVMEAMDGRRYLDGRIFDGIPPK